MPPPFSQRQAASTSWPGAPPPDGWDAILRSDGK